MFIKLILFILMNPALAYTLSGGQLIEDFTSLDGADMAASTGLWNIVAGRAQAGAVSNGSSARSISFGDGSDGALSASSGTVTFDTSARPNGYNYTSISIGAGATIVVTGSNPLILRSLSTVTIAPTINISGNSLTAVSNGVANGVTTAPAGGAGRACGSTAGSGGAVSAGPTASNGANGTNASGASEGNQGLVGAVDGSPATTSATSATFDTTGFVCGGSGGGGASKVDGATYSTGAGGGAGGGAIRITAVGALSVGTINASGGNGGVGVSDGTACSGHGGGGAGGAVWLQTLGTLTTGANPVVTEGTGGSGGGCGAGTGASIAGDRRGDSAAGSRPAWAGAAAANDTDNAAAGQVTYVVQSKAYDLGTFSATFGNPTVTSTVSSNGSVSVTYAGSGDGSTYSSYVSNLPDLSSAGYRYLKFRVTITTATAAAATSSVSRIVIPFGDAGLSRVEADLSTGCAFLGIRNVGKGQGPGPGSPPRSLVFWTLLGLAAYAILRWGLPFSRQTLGRIE